MVAIVQLHRYISQGAWPHHFWAIVEHNHQPQPERIYFISIVRSVHWKDYSPCTKDHMSADIPAQILDMMHD